MPVFDVRGLYTRKPDGEDCFAKILFCVRNGAFAGAAAALVDVTVLSKTQGYAATALKSFSTTAPFVLSAATFAAVACASTNLRKKDDMLNYMIAGSTAGAVMGISFNNRPVAIGLGVIGIFGGYLIKSSLQEGWNWTVNPSDSLSDGSQYTNIELYRKPSAKS